MFLVLKKVFIFYLILFSWHGRANDASVFEIKKELKNYLNVLIENGFGHFGTQDPLNLRNLYEKIDQTQFIKLSDEAFAYNENKTRRSAFYTFDGRVFINADNPPTIALLIHEILKDEHYEVSNGIAAIFDLITTEKISNDSMTIAQALQRSVGTMVDRFGPGANSPHQWLGDKEVEKIQSENMVFSNDGGDISGGGGDGGGFEFKSKVLLTLMNRLAPLYRHELGYYGERLINKLANLHFFLSIKIYFETDYSSQSDDKNMVRFGTDSIERLLFFPYFVQIPAKIEDQQVTETVDIILQSDLFREIPSLEMKYNSPCFCVTGLVTTRLPFLCPDPEKTHKALHQLMKFYKERTEEEYACRIVVKSDKL